MTLAEEEQGYVRAYQEHGERIKLETAAKDAAKARLMHAMGSASIGRLSDGTVLTRKEIARKGYTVEATTYVDFRIRSPKKEP